MKIPTAICIFSTLFFAACSSCPVMEIAEQGSFAVGGKVLKNSEGKTFHGDHAYVFYQIPPNARKYALYVKDCGMVEKKRAKRIKNVRSTSKIVEWEKKKRAKRIKNVLQCPMC